MKKLILLALIVSIGFGCELYFPDALSSNTKIKGIAKLDNIDNTLSSPTIDGKFICKRSINFLNNICKSEKYDKTLPKITFKTSNSNDTLYIDKDITITNSNIGKIIITKPNITITFKAPPTKRSLTNYQMIKSIKDDTGSATLIFKGGDYYIEKLKVDDDERVPSFRVNKTSFKINTPNNSRLFIKEFKVENNKPIPLNISLNKDNNSNALLIYVTDNFDIDTKGKLQGNFYLYGYKDIYLKADPMSKIKGAIHADGKLTDLGVGVKYIKPKDMYRLIVCNTLPPMPNSTKNSKTLLGIDSNNNGIRDDVEIRLLRFKPNICNYRPYLKECKETNPAFIAVGFQYARAFQTILKEFDGSRGSAYELTKFMDRAVDCDSYFTIDNKYWYENGGKLIEEWLLNTKKRKNFYDEYDEQLSGGLFSIGEKSDDIKGCDFNVTAIEGEIK